jgi:hypothetical protein
VPLGIVTRVLFQVCPSKRPEWRLRVFLVPHSPLSSVRVECPPLGHPGAFLGISVGRRPKPPNLPRPGHWPDHFRLTAGRLVLPSRWSTRCWRSPDRLAARRPSTIARPCVAGTTPSSNAFPGI